MLEPSSEVLDDTSRQPGDDTSRRADVERDRNRRALSNRDTSPRGHRDASRLAGADTSRSAELDVSLPSSARRICAWCRGPIPVEKRIDAVTCSKPCRQARCRFRSHFDQVERAALPIRLAYADPPYPGLAHYYRGHPDYAGEVDHAALLSRLQPYDGWALSTSADALPFVLGLCLELELEVRVAAWFRGDRGCRSKWPRNGWEPVVYAGGRRLTQEDAGTDALVYHSRPRLTDPKRVIGAKPAAFAAWLFKLLGARPGDQFDDLFPGSGGMGRAWRVFGS